jgi:two-component system alkaline phosphatase synthesis response regulator PhoP
MSEKKLVMIVDDEPDAIAFAEDVLSDLEGVETVTANDGDSALAKIRERKPDMVILDVQMPGKNGFAVFSELRADEATRDLPVAMLTGVAEKEGISFSAADMGEFLGAEPQAYIEKPVDPDKLQQAVTEVLGL